MPEQLKGQPDIDKPPEPGEIREGRIFESVEGIEQASEGALKKVDQRLEKIETTVLTPEKKDDLKQRLENIRLTVRRLRSRTEALLVGQYLKFVRLESDPMKLDGMKGYIGSVAGLYPLEFTSKDGAERKSRIKMIRIGGGIVRDGLYDGKEYEQALVAITSVVRPEKLNGTLVPYAEELPRTQYLRYITENLDIIEPHIRELGTLRSLVRILRTPGLQQKELAPLIDFMRKNFNGILTVPQNSDDVSELEEVIAEHGDDDQWQAVTKNHDRHTLAARLSYSELSKARLRGRELLEPMLYGMPATETLKAWRLSGSNNPYFWSFAERNLQALGKLESERPGAALQLNQEFGIFDFDRYPTEVLVAQYDRRNEDVPYGVVILPQEDHSGTLYDSTHHNLKELFPQFQGEYALRIMEVAGKIDIARKLIALKEKYGETQKIQFVIVSAHGNKDIIALGGNDTQGIILSSDIEAKNKSGESRLKTLSDFLAPDATVVIGACVTGTPGGIGQKLSELLGRKVIAPNSPTTTEHIRVDLSTGHPEFTVTYSGSDEKLYYSGSPLYR